MLAKGEYFCHVGFCSQLAVCESVEEFSVRCQSSNEEAFKEFSECVIEVYASVGCWVCFVLAVSFVDRLKEIKLPVCELRVRVPQTVERGIYLNNTLAKFFEDLLITRLASHTELLNTLTDTQLA